MNNAGVMLLAFGPERSGEHRRMVETNLIGAMTASEVFLERLREGGGHIVNVSSVAGHIAPAEDARLRGHEYRAWPEKNAWSMPTTMPRGATRPTNSHRQRRTRFMGGL